MEGARYPNLLRGRLARGEFVASIEFVTPERAEPLEGAIAPVVELGERIKDDLRFHAIALTDRVRSDDDHDPILVSQRVAEASGRAPIVPLSGKDRDIQWLLDGLKRMRGAGLENMLLVTGDRVKSESANRRVRYLDSVNMIAEARALGGVFHIGAAVSPFKYREEESMTQYLKMAKKEHAGVDFFITQVGWDMLKLKELAAYRRRRGFRTPVMAGLMLLTVARVRYVRSHKLAGITVADEFQSLLEAEAALPDKGLAKAYRRLALQIVGLKRLGFAGFQLAGMHRFEKLDKLFSGTESLDRELTTEADWWQAWWEALRGPHGQSVGTAPRPFYLFAELAEPDGWRLPADHLTLVDSPGSPVRRGEFAKFRGLDLLDRLIFREGSPGAAVLAPLARRVTSGTAMERGLHWIERRLKEPVVGCQTCGFCRLPYTSYICPETCPKGLANGPCGGTSENMCEFGDRECIHNRKYRIAKRTGRLDELETLIIPAVDERKRYTCSWTNHFRGEDPPVLRLIPSAARGGLPWPLNTRA